LSLIKQGHAAQNKLPKRPSDSRSEVRLLAGYGKKLETSGVNPVSKKTKFLTVSGQFSFPGTDRPCWVKKAVALIYSVRSIPFYVVPGRPGSIRGLSHHYLDMPSRFCQIPPPLVSLCHTKPFRLPCVHTDPMNESSYLVPVCQHRPQGTRTALRSIYTCPGSFPTRRVVLNLSLG
jgi:hypothetical protein